MTPIDNICTLRVLTFLNKTKLRGFKFKHPAASMEGSKQLVNKGRFRMLPITLIILTQFTNITMT